MGIGGATSGAGVVALGAFGLKGCCSGGYGAGWVTGYLANRWLGGGGSSWQAAMRKPVSKRIDNKDFIGIGSATKLSRLPFVAND